MDRPRQNVKFRYQKRHGGFDESSENYTERKNEEDKSEYIRYAAYDKELGLTKNKNKWNLLSKLVQ